MEETSYLLWNKNPVTGKRFPRREFQIVSELVWEDVGTINGY